MKIKVYGKAEIDTPLSITEKCIFFKKYEIQYDILGDKWTKNCIIMRGIADFFLEINSIRFSRGDDAIFLACMEGLKSHFCGHIPSPPQNWIGQHKSCRNVLDTVRI